MDVPSVEQARVGSSVNAGVVSSVGLHSAEPSCRGGSNRDGPEVPEDGSQGPDGAVCGRCSSGCPITLVAPLTVLLAVIVAFGHGISISNGSPVVTVLVVVVVVVSHRPEDCLSDIGVEPIPDVVGDSGPTPIRLSCLVPLLLLSSALHLDQPFLGPPVVPPESGKVPTVFASGAGPDVVWNSLLCPEVWGERVGCIPCSSGRGGVAEGTVFPGS